MIVRRFFISRVLALPLPPLTSKFLGLRRLANHVGRRTDLPLVHVHYSSGFVPPTRNYQFGQCLRRHHWNASTQPVHLHTTCPRCNGYTSAAVARLAFWTGYWDLPGGVQRVAQVPDSQLPTQQNRGQSFHVVDRVYMIVILEFNGVGNCGDFSCFWYLSAVVQSFSNVKKFGYLNLPKIVICRA